MQKSAPEYKVKAVLKLDEQISTYAIHHHHHPLSRTV